MLAFALITVFSVALAVFSRSFIRFRVSRPAASVEGKAPAFSWPEYSAWTRRRTKEILAKGFPRRGWAILKPWAAERYPGWLGWVFAGLAASFFYLAASGLAFAMFSPRGMFGAPLLLHVVLGGLFALSLAGALFWRARDYFLVERNPDAAKGPAGLVFTKLSRDAFRKILFWTFAVFGFVQIVTALGSMLPTFTFRAQMTMIAIHRWTGLAIVLVTIVFVDLAILPWNKYGDTSLIWTQKRTDK
jgi:hypothetical protein